MPNSSDSYLAMTGDGKFRTLTAALAALAVSGCVSEQTASRFLVEPDRYILYNCAALETTAQSNAVRQRELEGLMAKAGSGAGGQLVSTMTYQPEYLQLRGEMDQLRKAAADKNCKFTLGVGGAGGRSSDQVVR